MACNLQRYQNDAAGPVSHWPIAMALMAWPADGADGESQLTASRQSTLLGIPATAGLLVCAIPAQGVQRVSPY